jgi:hypothetical protein
MKREITLMYALALSPAFGAQSLVNATNYADLFSPGGANVTVDVPNTALLSFGGSASGPLGTYWSATADGGSTIGFGLAESGAQVALTGSSLQFNVANIGLIDNLIDGGLAGLTTSWTATATFDKPGSELVLSSYTTYEISFLLDGDNGLLESIVGLNPTFTFELLDGNGQSVAESSNSTILNLVGIFGTGVTSGTATFSFTTGDISDTDPASVRFSGGAILTPELLGIGSNFATISNFSIVQVPEPSVCGIIALSGLLFLKRRR